MALNWTDVLDIAIELAESKPDVDPRYVNFVELHRWVTELPDFSDDPTRGVERSLAAVQAQCGEEACAAASSGRGRDARGAVSLWRRALCCLWLRFYFYPGPAYNPRVYSFALTHQSGV